MCARKLVASLGVALAAAGLALPADPERDRRAILAMAGTYTVSFDFAEVVAVAPGYRLREPYHATAEVEEVEVVEDSPGRIVLQHVLLDGERVVKHWRQDWLYENRDLYEFAGHGTWRHRRLTEEEARGAWTQRVYQVDDSPRYQGHGRWVHEGGLSAWESGWVWRPLPRRERSRRDDYDVLVGRNRHTLTHTGWVHEQDNFKLALRDGGSRVLAREIGHNRYDHVDPAKAEAARRYWEETRAFWSVVRAEWEAVLVPEATVTVRPAVAEKPLWKAMTELADASKDLRADAVAPEVRGLLAAYVE